MVLTQLVIQEGSIQENEYSNQKSGATSENAGAWTDPIIFEPTQKDIAAALERESRWAREELEPGAGSE